MESNPAVIATPQSYSQCPEGREAGWCNPPYSRNLVEEKAFNTVKIIQFAWQGKARQVYLYSTFHTQWQCKVLYMEEIKIIKRNQNN